MPNPPKHTRFKKGQSGNPRGRPKKLPQLDTLLADVLGDEKDGVTAAEAILRAIRAKAARGDVRAAEVLLDRAWGKPKQTVTQTIDLHRVREMSDAELDEAAKAIGLDK